MAHATIKSLMDAWINTASTAAQMPKQQYLDRQQFYFLGASSALGLVSIKIADKMREKRRLDPIDVAEVIQGLLRETQQTLTVNSDEIEKL